MLNYTWANYVFRTNGVHTMLPDDPPPENPDGPRNWIIPAAIVVQVPPPQVAQNQVIRENGNYELYDANPQQNDGVEINPDQNPPPYEPPEENMDNNRSIVKFRKVDKTRDGETDNDKPDYLGNFTVQVDLNLQDNLNYNVTSPGTFEILPESNYTGLSKVTVNNTAIQEIDNYKVNAYTSTNGNDPDYENVTQFTSTITPTGNNYALSSVKCKSSVCSFKQVEVTNNDTINLDITDDYPAGDVLGYRNIQIIPDIHPNLQDKTVQVRSNGIQTITANNGYDGLDEVTIDTLITPNLENKTVNVDSSGTQTVSASTGYDGLGTVTINSTLPTPALNLQNKTENIATNGTKTVTCDNGYDGLGEVTIDTLVTPNLENKTVNVDSSGTQTVSASSGYDGLGIVTINSTIPTPNLQNKTENIATNGTKTVTCDNGYDGLGTVTINTSVSTPIELNSIYLKDGSNDSFNLIKYQGLVEQTTPGNHTFNIQLNIGSANENQYLYVILVNYKADPCTICAKRIASPQSNVPYNLEVTTTATIFGMYYTTTNKNSNGYFEICQGTVPIFYLTPSRTYIVTTSGISDNLTLEPRRSRTNDDSLGGFSIIDIANNNKIVSTLEDLFE